MADYVGRWDCNNCEAVVWGILRHCPNCGANTTGKYYLPPGEPLTTEEKVMQIIQAGANWKCRYCKSDNYGDTKFCTECGADQNGSPTRQTHEYAPGDTPSSEEEVSHDGQMPPIGEVYDVLKGSGGPATDVVEVAYTPSSDIGDVHSSYAPSSSSSMDDHRSSEGKPTLDFSRLVKPGLIVSVIVGIIILGYFIFRPYEVQTKVDRFEWSRTIHVDQYRTVREGAWSIPAAGRYVSQEQRVHHYDTVFDHYETSTRQVVTGSESYDCGDRDNGNGTFSDIYCTRSTYGSETYQEAVYRQEPRYATWYNYDIDKWVPSRSVPTGDTGRTDPLPYWGQLVLRCENQPVLGCESLNRREEHYVVVFTWMDREIQLYYPHEEDRTDWDTYEPQGDYTLVMNSLRVLLNDPLRPEVDQ